MLLPLLLPFIRAFKGELWHDTISIILPPHIEMIPIEYYAAEKPALLYYLYPGEARIYNPETGALGDEVKTMDAGFVHSHPGYMKEHHDPLVHSFLKENPYEFVGWVEPGKPHFLWMYNRTDSFIWFDLTIWVAEFPSLEVEVAGEKRELPEVFDQYLRGIFNLFYTLGEAGVSSKLGEHLKEAVGKKA